MTVNVQLAVDESEINNYLITILNFIINHLRGPNSFQPVQAAWDV